MIQWTERLMNFIMQQQNYSQIIIIMLYVCVVIFIDVYQTTVINDRLSIAAAVGSWLDIMHILSQTIIFESSEHHIRIISLWKLAFYSIL